MNLKEAFRFQNQLKRLEQMTDVLLTVQPLITKVETICLRSKVMPEAEDEVTVAETSHFCRDRINELIDFRVFLLEQRIALGKAIRVTKAGLELDIDLEMGLNKQRQSMADTFKKMACLRASETVESGGGIGYRFNAEGNQVTYRCDLKKVTTINFDRNKVRKLAAKLYKQADEISTQLDVALVTAQVDYQPPFDVNSTLESIFEDFCETRN